MASVIGIGAALPARDSATTNPPIATRSTAEDWPPESDIPLSDLAPVAYDFGTGETTLQKGWSEVDRVGPFTSGNSLAVAATDGEKTIYAYFESPSEIAFTEASRTTSKDFQTWADDISLNPLEATRDNGDLAVGDDGWIWLVGGGDLVGQFDDAGLLDEVVAGICPVTLGVGAPLLPRRITYKRMSVIDVLQTGEQVQVRYRIARP